MCIRDLNIEFEKLRSTESIESAQAATATSHKEWLDIKSDDFGGQRDLSDWFSSGRALKEKRILQALKVHEASKEYYNQGEPRSSDY